MREDGECSLMDLQRDSAGDNTPVDVSTVIISASYTGINTQGADVLLTMCDGNDLELLRIECIDQLIIAKDPVSVVF